MNRFRLKTLLIFAFVLQIVLLMAGSGYVLDWQTRRMVEEELSRNLTAIAQLAAQDARQTTVINLLPGEDQARTARAFAAKMARYTTLPAVDRLILATPDKMIFYDSQGLMQIGDLYGRLAFDRFEIEAARAGDPVASKLYTGSSGAPFKAAYAKVAGAGEAFICVEGEAAGLAAVAELRQSLLLLGLFSAVLAALLGGVIARQLTAPLEALEHNARRIEKGEQPNAFNREGSREIAFLATRLEAMQEALLARQRRQELMLAGVAHEIRNPLGGISLFTDVLAQKAPEDLQPQVARIRKELLHLQRIVASFVDYARPAMPNPTHFSLSTCCDEAIASLENGNKDVNWQVNIPRALKVFADYDQIRQVLTNLMQNSVQALADSGKAQICVKAAAAGDEARILLSDNGPGIAPEVRARIFEPFFTTKSQGSGLGLALVNILVEANAGRIWLDSPAAGTQFALTLPLRKHSS